MKRRANAGQSLRTITPVDVVVIAILIIASILMIVLPPLFREENGAVTARITCGGELYAEIDLNAVAEAYEIELPTEPKTTVAVEPGSIRFVRADCPDQVCVNTGALAQAGDTAACVPAGAVITLYAPDGGEEYDAIAY